MCARQAESVAQIVDQEQTWFHFVLAFDTIHVNADSLLHKSDLTCCDISGRRFVLADFLCQFEMKVNGGTARGSRLFEVLELRVSGFGFWS
jgi:hypothetical protein